MKLTKGQKRRGSRKTTVLQSQTDFVVNDLNQKAADNGLYISMTEIFICKVFSVLNFEV